MLKFSFSPFSLCFITSILGGGRGRTDDQNHHHHHYYSSHLAGCDLFLSQPTKMPSWFLFRSKSKEECILLLGPRSIKMRSFPKEKVWVYDKKHHKIKLLNPNPSLRRFCAQDPSTSSISTLDCLKSEVDLHILCRCGST